MRYYRPVHFKLYELVDPETYTEKGEVAWKFLDPDVLEAIDILRALFGPLTVNDWYWGGKFKWSGLRTPESNLLPLSAHFRGCAFDVKSNDFNGVEMRHMLQTFDEYKLMTGCKDSFEGNWTYWTKRLFNLINEIEDDTPTWLHIAKTNRETFLLIPNPNK